jgi:hypothetical protein
MVLNQRSNKSKHFLHLLKMFPPHSAVTKCVNWRLGKIFRLACVSATNKTKVPCYIYVVLYQVKTEDYAYLF